MEISAFIGEPYFLNPENLAIDTTYSVFNVLHTEQEYEATKLNIAKIGQTSPIYMLNGKIIDGRHRTKIAIELKRQIKCIDVNPALDRMSIILLCNPNIMSGRELTVSQRAIKALELEAIYKFTHLESAKLLKVDRRLISHVSYIKSINRIDILDQIMLSQAVKLKGMAKPSKSLEVIAKHLKSAIEENKVKEIKTHEVDLDPEVLINTEKGKAWFATKVEMLDVTQGINLHKTIELKKDYIEMANLKFVYIEEHTYDGIDNS